MRAAVIGAGFIARQHLACLRALPGVQTVGVCDLSPSLAESAAERFGIAEWYTNHRRMLDEARPDVVHIATPPGSHYALAIDSLEAGAHVIVEKPATVRYEELTHLIELARRKGRMLLEDCLEEFETVVSVRLVRSVKKDDRLFDLPPRGNVERRLQGTKGDRGSGEEKESQLPRGLAHLPGFMAANGRLLGISIPSMRQGFAFLFANHLDDFFGNFCRFFFFRKVHLQVTEIFAGHVVGCPIDPGLHGACDVDRDFSDRDRRCDRKQWCRFYRG